MMRKLLKTMSCVLSAMLLTATAASVAGCENGCGKKKGDASEITMMIWNSGWGVDGYQTMAEEFNKLDKGFTVKIDFSSDQTSIANDYAGGFSENAIFVNPIRNVESYSMLEPLDDVLDSTYGDETTKIKDKIPQYYLDHMIDAEGSIGMLPTNAQFNGIVYNKSLFDEGGFDVPRTTDELEALCTDTTFNTDEHKAWIHFQDGYNGYYPYIMDVWVAQYNGKEGWNKLQKLSNDVNEAKAIYSAKDGRYEMLKVLGACVNTNTVHGGSNNSNFTVQQKAFLHGDAMMMVNGNWLGVEMQKNEGSFDGSKFSMMRNPVISSIRKVVPDKSIENDAELCKMIDYIDAGTAYNDTDKTFTENDYNRIAEARGTMGSGGCASGIYIPNYADDAVKENAKEFLRFMYSDEGGKIWRDLKHVDPIAEFDDKSLYTSYDYSSWSAWEKNNKTLYESITNPIGEARTRSMFYVQNGRDIYANVDFITPLTSSNVNDQHDAEWLWNNNDRPEKCVMGQIEANWASWAAVLG